MKIALITRRYPPLIGGAERVLSYLAPALAAEGADVTVLTSRPFDFDGPEIETVHPAKGNGKLTVVRIRTSRLRFVGTWLYMWGLKRILRSQAFDVAYVSMLKHDAYATLEVAHSRRFPVVLRPEGAGATGDVAWQSWGRFGSKIAARCKTADAFVSISTAVAEELKRGGYDPSKIKSLPNGVPIPEPVWNRRDQWREQPRAAYVGRLSREKGVDLLIDAWPAVLERFPKAQLVLIGDGPERLALESKARELSLEHAIRFHGFSNDPTSELRRSDLFILPSREEGMSIALLEAMALGIPLVATSIPGNRRLIQNLKQGRLAKPDDPADLAQAIIAQWSEFDRAFQMSRIARRRVVDEFSIQAVARKHLALFQALIEAHPLKPLQDQER